MNRPTVALRVLIALVCGAPCAAQQQSKIVQVGERSVEVIEMGNGTPTLILEGGIGESATDWSRVLPALAAHTRVIAYSRPGYGQSSAAAGPPSPQASVQQLHALLATLGEGAPVVIVGHSWGGLLARLYVSTYPREVAGLVLVDGTHEAQWRRWEALRPSFKIFDQARAAMSRIPPPTRGEMEQMLAVQTNGRVVEMRPLPDVPLAVITAVKPCAPEREWMCRDARALAEWRALHAEWAAQSTNSIHVVSARTEHDVMHDQPDLVIEAVRFVLDATRLAAR
jgi:pimeloyl-ACP methyl ester carboxylesterase